MSNRFVATQDGSISATQADLGELYHNRQGAYTEALVNYASPTIELLGQDLLGQDLLGHDSLGHDLPGQDLPQALVMLDICFGLGYNTLVLLELLSKLDKDLRLTVTAVDNDPDFVAEALPLVLEQTQFRCFDKAVKHNLLIAFRDQHWHKFFVGKVEVRARLLAKDLRLTLSEDLKDSKVGLIYHDPFAPQKVPVLWTSEVFGHYKAMLQLAPGALFTYASAGAVRGAMLENQFCIYQTAKLGGKNGGTLATTKPLTQAQLDRAQPGSIALLPQSEQIRLQKSSRVPFRDIHGTTPEQMRKAREAEQRLMLEKSKNLNDSGS